MLSGHTPHHGALWSEQLAVVRRRGSGEDPESGLGLLTSGIDLRDLVGVGKGWVEGIHQRTGNKAGGR